jgi:hypothetical protein
MRLPSNVAVLNAMSFLQMLPALSALGLIPSETPRFTLSTPTRNFFSFGVIFIAWGKPIGRSAYRLNWAASTPIGAFCRAL